MDENIEVEMGWVMKTYSQTGAYFWASEESK